MQVVKSGGLVKGQSSSHDRIRRSTWRRDAIFSLAILLIGAGCQQGDQLLTRHAPLPPAGRVYVIDLPGMYGWTIADLQWVEALEMAGVGDCHEIYDWTIPNKLIGALVAYDHNRSAAKYIADAIVAKKRQEPDARFILSAWSAGSAVVLWTLEYLPDDVIVEDVVFVQAAVDPNHDLTTALRHVRGHLFAFQSPFDCITLGMGTLLFGTADDGVHTASVGFVGFNRPASADEAAYAKVVSLPYDFGWIWLGDFGTHLSQMSPSVAREVVAPLIMADLKPHDTTGATSKQGQ